VVLRSLWTWALSGLALASFGLLFLVPVWVPFRELDEGGFHVDHMRMHLEGMWVAFGVAAGFIVYFVQRVTRALAAREAELLAARSLAARHEKLTSLATLAAGAAHELSTPLSTIAVVAKELERQLAPAGRAEVVADVHLIREQVRRCHDILQQMAAEAGEGAGEGISAVAIEDLVCTAIDGAVDPARVEISLAESARGRVLHVPPRALAQALRGVLKNAAQASPPVRKIRLHVACDDGSWRFQVRDEGSGMSADVLQRTGEPFFTTKSPGQGMGLGLFLTRAVLARLGGRLEIDSEPGGGTTAVLVLPEQPPRRGVDGTAVPTAA
jgi:two-component system sensor histidine kinase RegB